MVKTVFTGCVAFNTTEAAYSATGFMFRLYCEHFGTIKVYTLNPPELMSANRPTGDPVVTIKESTVKKAPEKILVAPYGISLYELELK